MRVRLKRDVLIEALSRSGLTQNHWAMKLGISRGHFSEVVNGKHLYLSPRTREKFVDGFGLPFDDLFEIEDGDAFTHDSSAHFQAALADRYLIDKELGQGGMGTVYLARDVKHGRLVAVKVISPEVVSGVGGQQFLSEIRRTAWLEHPNILTMLDSGEAAGYPYYVMPYVRDGSLSDLLAKKGRLALSETARILDGVADGLQYAHENRLLHCDLKPANILLSRGRAYLADFGISRVVHAETRAWGRRGEIDSSAGTPAYVSPEQASGEPDLDGRSDVYSLGCVVYEMLTGVPPFTGTTTMDTVSQRFTSMIPNVRDIAPDVPLAIARVVERAMTIDVHRRYQSAAEFMTEFSHAVESRRPAAEAIAMAWTRATRRLRPGSLVRGPHRSQRRGMLRMDQFVNDVRFAARSLRKRPGFTVVALLTLGLGIGANTAVFSMINGIFFWDSGVAEREDLIELYRLLSDGRYFMLSPQDIEDLREGSGDLYTGITAYKNFSGQVGFEASVGAGAADLVLGELVTGNYFDVLGVGTLVGRTFLPEEDATPETHPVTILSRRYWLSRFQGDRSVVGREIRLNGRPYTVIGVTAEAFAGKIPGALPDLWVPMMMQNHLSPSAGNNLVATARLRPNVVMSQARTAMATLGDRLNRERPESNRSYSFAGLPSVDVTVHPGLDGPIRAMALILIVVVGMVLLITCTNLASFLLARAMDRRKEMAVRIALGAERGVIMRQLLTESVMLSVLGGLAGLVLGVLGVRALVSLEPPLGFPINVDFSLDLRVLCFTLAVAVLAGILFGLAPAFQATRAELASTLRDESGGVAGGTRKVSLRNTLVVAQMAMSLLLLIGTGLFVRSLQHAVNVDVGFDTAPAAIVTVSARGSGYDEDDWPLLYRRLRDAMAGVPGVSAVATTSRMPLAIGITNRFVTAPGVEPPRGQSAFRFDFAAVSPEFFDVVGVPLLSGRGFDSGDRDGTQRVVVLSQAATEMLWPGQDPIGKVIRFGSSGAESVVIGVSGNAKIRSLSEEPRPYIYEAYAQDPMSEITFVTRGAVAAEEQVRAMRQAALTVDPDLFVSGAKTMSEHLGVMFYLPRMAAGLLAVFAGLALTIASVGLYGVVSYAVSQRTREMGIRMSLGAQGRDVVALVLRGGVGLVVIGGVIGLALAVALTRMLEGLLVGVTGLDPLTFLVVPLVLGGVAVSAAYVPARRASRVNPMIALRAE